MRSVESLVGTAVSSQSRTLLGEKPITLSLRYRTPQAGRIIYLCWYYQTWFYFIPLFNNIFACEVNQTLNQTELTKPLHLQEFLL